MTPANTKRRAVFIKRGFQAKFIAWVIGLLLVCCFCSTAMLYPLLSSEMSSQLSSGHHAADLAQQRVILAIVTGNLLAVIVAALASAVVVLYISHKIAGPLYRFERICEEVGRGNLEVSAKLRDADQLGELAQAFEGMLDKLRRRERENSLRLEDAQAALSKLAAEAGMTSVQTERLQAVQKQLEVLAAPATE